MAKRIYIIIGILALASMIYFIISPGNLSTRTLVWIVTILYAIFEGSLHGVIAHGLTARQKGSLIFYPFLMGVLFSVLVLIYIFVVLPMIIPGFMNY